MTNQIIKQYFSKFKVVSVNAVKKFKQQFPEAFLFLSKALKENPNFLTEQNYITCIVKNITLPFCLNCQKQLTYKHFLQHKKFCCLLCAAKYNSKNKSTKILNLKGHKTIKEKYHIENISQLESIKEKVKISNEQTCLKKYGSKSYSLYLGWKKILSYSKYIKPLFSQLEYTGNNKEYLFECCKCHKQFKSKIYITGHIERTGSFSRVPRCFSCYPTIDKVSSSNAEKDLIKFCKQYYPSLIEHSYKLTSPYELDIVIPELKLAIEFNGLYWHSTKFKKSNYHLNKVLLCNKAGYRLIHVWEDDWTYNKIEIQQKLIDIFNQTENLNFTTNIIELDRSWFNNILIPNYQIIQITKPEIINRHNFQIENCGKIILKHT